MADTDLQRLIVRLEANDREFARKMDRIERKVNGSMRGVDRRVSRTSRAVAGLGKVFGGLLAAASVGAFVRRARQAVSALDDIGKTADKVGLTTDQLQLYRAAAESAGVATNTFDMAMQRFSRRIAEARNGTGEALKVVNELGLELRDANGVARSSSEVFLDLADKMATMDDATERLRIGFKFFDSEGAALVNMLREGSVAITATTDKFREMGLVIEEDLIRNAEETQNQLDLLARVLDAQVSSALVKVGPLLVDVANFMNDLFEATSRVVRELRQLAGVDLADYFNEVDAEALRLQANVLAAQKALEAAEKSTMMSEEGLRHQRQALADAQEAWAKYRDEVMKAPTVPVIAPPAVPPAPTGGGGGGGVPKPEAPAPDFTNVLGAALDMEASLQRQIGLLDMTAQEAAKAQAQWRLFEEVYREFGNSLEKIDQAVAEGLLPPDWREQIDAAAESIADMTIELDELRDANYEAAQAQYDMQRGIEAVGNALIGVIDGTLSWEQALLRVAQAILQVNSVQNALGQAAVNLFSGGGGGGGFLGNLFGNLLGGGGPAPPMLPGLAKGAAFVDGKVTPFARGGVVDRPTLFPMANGAGLMGEAGPEAIMPLRRGPGGRLGVEAAGGGGGITVGDTYVYVTEPGVTREELIRAVAEGNRRQWQEIQSNRRRDGDFLGP